jgi:hypothetical protein
MTNKERKFLDRLKKRVGILDARLKRDLGEGTRGEIQQERNALAWAIEKLGEFFNDK